MVLKSDCGGEIGGKKLLGLASKAIAGCAEMGHRSRGLLVDTEGGRSDTTKSQDDHNIASRCLTVQRLLRALRVRGRQTDQAWKTELSHVSHIREERTWGALLLSGWTWSSKGRREKEVAGEEVLEKLNLLPDGRRSNHHGIVRHYVAMHIISLDPPMLFYFSPY
jgi:hypothetical protein